MFIISFFYYKLLFNCGALSYVSSTGLGSFTILLKMVKVKGGDIILSTFSDLDDTNESSFSSLNFSFDYPEISLDVSIKGK